MFNRVKNALYNVVGSLDAVPVAKGTDSGIPLKFRYSRPQFLQLTDDEIQVTADHVIRPIIVPRDITNLPWYTGYAEAINAGKSIRNEDQATMYKGVLSKSVTTVSKASKEVKAQSSPPPSPIVDSPADTAVENSNSPAAGEPALLENGPSSSSSQPVSVFATPPSTPEPARKIVTEQTLPYIYFGIFDGHAGSGAAVVAANTLHKIIHEKLRAVVNLLLPTKSLEDGDNKAVNSPFSYSSMVKQISIDELITGALESAFWEMDRQIQQDKIQYKVTGGCTALAAVFIFGKLYVSNAGDSRAIICQGLKATPMSQDFTPETERDRIRYLGLLRPEFLGNEFTHLEYVRRPVRKDLGKQILYRDAYMSGWAYKTVSLDDLRFPLIYGEGKRSRVLATIGVTRGFGDHDLKAQSTDILIKPFLTAQPEVRIFDLTAIELTDADVLVMGTDGLWDITTNDKAAEVISKSIDHFPANDTQRYKYRYISAAQDLVMHSRGKLRERNWKTSDNKPATIDDISVFVIPLRNYKEEYLTWKATYENFNAI